MKNDSSRFGHIIQLFTVLLTAILISLFFAALVLVGKIQGTARVVNYAGLVRGKRTCSLCSTTDRFTPRRDASNRSAA